MTALGQDLDLDVEKTFLSSACRSDDEFSTSFIATYKRASWMWERLQCLILLTTLVHKQREGVLAIPSQHVLSDSAGALYADVSPDLRAP